MAFWNRKVEESAVVDLEYHPMLSDNFSGIINLTEQFKGEIEKKDVKFPTELGEEHPFDFKTFEELYKKFGFFTAVVDKYIDFVVGPGFYVECEDERAKTIIEDFMKDTDFETLLRAWCKEALIKGSGFLEIGGSAKEGVKGLKVLNANYMYVVRNNKGEIQGYNQYTGAFDKVERNKVIPFSVEQIAHCPFNVVGDGAYGIGIGSSALKAINNVLMVERDSHRIMQRKANSPLHAKLGRVDGNTKIIPKPEDVAAFGQKMEIMDNKTEWATDDLVDLKVVDFGNLGEKFNAILEHDMTMLTYIFQIPAVLLGIGNVPEGLARVQMEAFQRRIQSIQAELEKIIEEKIFKRVLNANGLDIHVEFQWGTPSVMEIDGKIKTATALLVATTTSPALKSMLEDEVVNLLELDVDEWEQKKLEQEKKDEEARKREENRPQPIVPGQNAGFPQAPANMKARDMAMPTTPKQQMMKQDTIMDILEKMPPAVKYKIKYVDDKIGDDYIGMNWGAAKELGVEFPYSKTTLLIYSKQSEKMKKETIRHEIIELNLMLHGIKYKEAHEMAEILQDHLAMNINESFKKKEELITPLGNIILEAAKKKHFLFIGDYGLALDYALHLMKEGHEVKYYYKQKSDVGDDLIEKVDSYEAWVDWADVIFIDDVGFGEVSEDLVKRGKKIINGRKEIEKLECDRQFGQDLLKKAKVPILKSKEFTDFDAAIEYIKTKPQKYVLKPITNMDRHFTYVGHMEDGSDMMQVLDKYKKEWTENEKIDFLLQEFVDGLEMAVTFICNGKEILKPYCLNFEHKHADTGDLGSMTGETGTVMIWTDKCDLFDKTVAKVQKYFKDYVGFADLNCMVDKDGNIYPLEWTAGRPGYPISCIIEECLNMPFGEFLDKLASGTLTEAPFEKNVWQIGVMMVGEGSPFQDAYKKLGNNMPIYGVKDIEEHIHFQEIKKIEKQLYTAGSVGDIIIVSSKDEDLEVAKAKVYSIIERGEQGVDDIYWEGLSYRTDIGDKVIENMDDLEEWGDIENDNEEPEEEKYVNKNYEYAKSCKHCEESWNDINDINEWLGFKYQDYIKYILANLKTYDFAQIKATTDTEAQAGYLSEMQINELKGILENGFKKGLSMSEMADEVDAKLGLKDLYRMTEEGDIKKGIAGLPILQKAKENRSISIVRSEITRLANQGAVDYYSENGIDKVKWVASFGARTCEDCDALNGTIYDIGEEAEMPLHPNCRCTYAPVVEIK